jgi:hypothetical protein
MKIFGVVDCVSKLDQARSEIGASFESYVAYFPTMAEQLNVFIQRTQELVGR